MGKNGTSSLLIYHLIFDAVIIVTIAVFFQYYSASIASINQQKAKELEDDFEFDLGIGDYDLDEDGEFYQTPSQKSKHMVAKDVNQNLAMRMEYSFGMVADLDLNSRNSQKFQWHSFLKKGTLKRKPNGNFTIEWGLVTKLISHTATNNRSMELSELVVWDKNLLAFCDYTGIVYKIEVDENRKQGKVFQRYCLADGNGNEPKPFKSEWATIKDGLLYIGSIGKEWVKGGKTIHYDPEWVKTIDSCGSISHLDWNRNYNALRKITNTTFPGFLVHEAVVWHPGIKRWLFLPRRASASEPYSPKTEETKGSNMLLIADEEFKNIEVKRIGPFEPLWGFTSMKVVPDTGEIIALKVMESTTHGTKTALTIFDLDGNFKLEPAWIEASDKTKYEGIEFFPVVV